MLPGQCPPNFPYLTFEIKSDQPIPFIRRNQRTQPYPLQKDPPLYPIHSPLSKTYNLFTTLEKMKPKEHIELKDYYDYAFAVTAAQTYASKLRRLKPPIQMYLRVEWHKQQQIGRIWRLG